MLRRKLVGLLSPLLRSRVSSPLLRSRVSSPLLRSRRSYSSGSIRRGDGGSSSKKIWSDWLPAALGCGGFLSYQGLYQHAMSQDITRKAIDIVSGNQEFLEAIGEPVIPTPWYLLAYKYYNAFWKNSVRSCMIQVTGPRGSGVLRVKAARTGDDSWFIFWRHDDWKIQEVEVQLSLSTDNTEPRTFTISLPDIIPPVLVDKESRFLDFKASEK